MQCGIASLSMICMYYGKNFSINKLSSLCHEASDGISLLTIKLTTEKIGFETMAGRLHIEELIKDNGPYILHWNQNHFVELYKVDRSGKLFWIADPGKGKYKLSLEEFKKHWVSTLSNGEEKGIAVANSLEGGVTFLGCNPKKVLPVML